MKKLFTVVGTYTVVCVGEDAYEAEEAFMKEVRDFDPDVEVTQIKSEADLPDAWDVTHIPSGDASNITIGDWLKGPSARRISVVATGEQMNTLKEAMAAVGIEWAVEE